MIYICIEIGGVKKIKTKLLNLLTKYGYNIIKLEEEKMKKQKAIPQLEYKKSSKKEIIWSIICFAIYIVIKDTSLLRLLFSTNRSITSALLISFVSDLIILGIAIFALKDIVKRDLKIFKENSKVYLKYLLPRFLKFLLIYIIVSAVCTKLLSNGQQSENQEVVNVLPIWYLISNAVIIGPILEEFIYRGIPRRFISNKIFFIIFSAIIFGISHVLFEDNFVNAIVNMIPYSVMGGFFAYIYASTENLTNSMLCHIVYNSIVVFFMIIAGNG